MGIQCPLKAMGTGRLLKTGCSGSDGVLVERGRGFPPLQAQLSSGVLSSRTLAVLGCQRIDKRPIAWYPTQMPRERVSKEVNERTGRDQVACSLQGVRTEHQAHGRCLLNTRRSTGLVRQSLPPQPCVGRLLGEGPQSHHRSSYAKCFHGFLFKDSPWETLFSIFTGLIRCVNFKIRYLEEL